MQPPLPQPSAPPRPVACPRPRRALWLLALTCLPLFARADIIPPGCTGNGYGISLFVEPSVARIGDTLKYSLQLSNQEFPACQAAQITAAITTPDGVTRPITLRRTTLNPGESDLYRDVLTYVVRDRDIAQGVVKAAANSTALINQSVSGIRSENYRDVSTPIVRPCLSLQARCTGGVGDSGPITFSGTVRNCGDTPLTNVTITQSATGETVLQNVTLAPGEERAFQGSYLPSNPCAPASNTLTAQAQDTLQPARPLTATIQVTCQNTLTPGLALAAECGPPAAGPGQPLTYQGTVRNTGNVTLTNVVILADKPAGNTIVRTVPRLAPGDSATFSGSYPAPQACDATLALSANGRTVCNVPVTAPSTSLRCLINNTPAVSLTSPCPTTPPAPGGRFSFSGTVHNTGDVTLRNLRVFSARSPGSPIFTTGQLLPGATANFNSAFNTPADACSITDTLTVIAENACGGPNLTNAITRTCPLRTTPSLQLTTQCPPQPVAPGQTFAFSGTVRNSGNVALKTVRVLANQPAPNTVVFSLESLAPGAAANFTGSFPVLADTCAVITLFEATALDVCTDAPVTTSTAQTCPVITSPRLQITSRCPADPTPTGSPLVYWGRVENLGDVTLTNIVVTSDRPAANTVVYSTATLAPGAAVEFSASYPAPLDRCSVTDTLTVTARSRCTGATLTERVTKTCPLTVQGTVALSILCPTSPATPGAALNYNGTVLNNGTVTLTDIVVVNDAAPDTPVFRIPNLAPGATASFQAPVLVPTNTCQLTSAFTVTAADPCGQGTTRDSTTTSCPIQNTPALTLTHECPASPLIPGASAPFSGTVRNTGNITLTNVTVVHLSSTLLEPTTLLPRQAASFSGIAAAAADTCTHTTTVTARGYDACKGTLITQTSERTCPVRTTPLLELGLACPRDPAPAGGALNYAGTVRNTGNVTLLDVTVNRGGTRVFGPLTLAPGATTSFTVETTAPSNACSVTQEWTASGRDRCSNATVTRNQSTTCAIRTTPAVALNIICPTDPLRPSTTARYSGTLHNPGDIALTSLVVTRAEAPDTPVFQLALLNPGATATFTADVPVPLDVCALTARFVVTAGNPCNTERLNQSAAATCPVSATAQLALAHDCPVTPGAPGQTVTFTGSVRNTGHLTVTNVVVTSGLGAPNPVLGPITLAPGQSATFTGQYPVPPITGSCTYRHTVRATATHPCEGTPVETNSATDCPFVFAPALSLVAACPETPVAPGERLTYTASVRNTGNVALRNLRIVNSLTGDDTVFTLPSLEPGASRTFTGSFLVPGDDCCAVTHTLTARAEDVCAAQEVQDTATTTCPIRFTPALALTQQCPTVPLALGDAQPFTGTVSNPGNVTLVEVLVRLRLAGQELPVLGPLALAPGQIVHFQGAFTVPADFCGQVELLAHGVDLCGQGEAQARLTSACPPNPLALLVVTKECPATPVPNNGIYAYTGTVRNAGHLTLTNVTVVNNQPAPNTLVFGPATLPPGTAASFAASYPIAADCCQVVETLTARGQEICRGQTVTNTATTVCLVLHTVDLELSKQCLDLNRATGLVRNTGTIGLSNVIVQVEYPTGPVRVLGPLELAVGETAPFAFNQTRDEVVNASAISLCGNQEITARTTCAGPITDPPPRLLGITADGHTVTILWTAIPGRTYRLDASPQLHPPAWQSLPGAVTATGPTASKTDTLTTSPHRFYRVRLMP